MANPVTGSIAELFRAETPSDRAIEFKWLLIRRRNRPFLLLPVRPKGAQVGLELYSAHRRRAKIWRGAIPLLLSTPAAAIFQRVHFLANEASEIMPFLVDQSGMQGAGILAPAIKFGSLENEKPRFVMLLCDQTNRPVKVIKVGIDKIGRAATEREADFLEKLPANTLGCIRLTGRLSTPHFSAFATAYFPGQSPEDDAGLETLFHSWINPGPEMAVENLDSWQELETVVASASPAAWQALRPALAGKTLRSTLYHGDFAPWNIRAVNSQNLQAFDWESGCLLGVPGWDWFHFIVQTSILAKRHSAQREPLVPSSNRCCWPICSIIGGWSSRWMAPGKRWNCTTCWPGTGVLRRRHKFQARAKLWPDPRPRRPKPHQASGRMRVRN